MKPVVCLWALTVSLSLTTKVQTAHADDIALTDWTGVEYAASTYAYYTLAYKFTVQDTPITVTKLGLYDHGGDGLNDNHEVAIWEEGNTTAIAVVTVMTNSPAEGPVIDGSGQFRYEPITGVTLQPGTSYRIGAYYEKFTGGTDYHARSGSETVSDYITYDGPCLKGDVDLDRGLAYPDGSSSRPSGYFGPNFQFQVDEDRTALTGWSGEIDYAASSLAYYTLGWKFTVTDDPIIVNKLGIFDYGSDGIADNHEVAIWEDGNTTPLLSVTVMTNSPMEGAVIDGSGRFRYVTTSPLVLRSGTTYRIGGYYHKLTGGTDLHARGSTDSTNVTESTDSAISYVGNCFAGNVDNYIPLTYPSQEATYRHTGYFGPNFGFSMAPAGTMILIH